MNNISISKMELSDLESLSSNFQTDFDDFWTVRTLESELENENSACFVMKNDSEIVGFACLWISVDDIHITNIAIKKSYRQNGFGGILLEHLIDYSKSTGKKELTLEVNENNEPAKKLYLKYGFKILGIRKKYYNNKENAIIMTLFF